MERFFSLFLVCLWMAWCVGSPGAIKVIWYVKVICMWLLWNIVTITYLNIPVAKRDPWKLPCYVARINPIEASSLLMQSSSFFICYVSIMFARIAYLPLLIIFPF